jgi:pyridoxal phosphate-dependent aminotransferase EpsN
VNRPAPTRRSPHRIHLSVAQTGGRELHYVQEAFATGWLSTVGPNLDALETEFSALVGAPSVALASGTAAIHLALKLVGVEPGDEVVAPTLTFAATCNPILHEKGRPVLIDSERASWNIDPDLVDGFLRQRAAVNRLPRAVIVVHLFGQCADLGSLVDACRRYEVPLIEDAAEALGALYGGRVPGTFGDIGIYSLNGNKIVTSAGGGVLVSPRRDWVERARHLATQARDPDPLGIENYVHSEAGFNYRMSNVLAGIARGQLEVLEARVRDRRAVFERYRAAFEDLDGIEPQPEATFADRRELAAAPARHTRWLSCFLVDDTRFGMSAGELIRFLQLANIQARPVWRPMHTQPLYRGCETIGGAIAEDLNRRAVCLPSSSHLSRDDQQFVVDCVREAGRRPGA